MRNVDKMKWDGIGQDRMGWEGYGHEYDHEIMT